MPIDRMDHFTILTTNTEETVAFYYDVLGFTPGPRPDFSFPGAWLYNGGKAVLHVVEKAAIPEGGGVLDHIAFFGSDVPSYLAKLKARGSNTICAGCLNPAMPAGCGNCSSSIRAAPGSRSTLRRRKARSRRADGSGERPMARPSGLAFEPGLPLRAATRKRDFSLRNNAIVEVGRGPLAARFGPKLPLALIAGPCQLESRAHALEMAAALKEIAERRAIGLVFKSSFDKANRTSGSAKRGVGLKAALPIFAEIRETLGLPVITDVHESGQCGPVAEAVDALQIPAFLCRQTDLLVAAALTGRPVNVKKGQFLAPWDMKNVVAKLDAAGAADVLVTERGASFGYNTLVSDMRALPILARETGAPVIFDATHSVQQPGGQGTASGGEREFVAVLARAAVAVGVAGVFIETHQDPDRAPSDGPNMVPLKEFEALIAELQDFDRLAKR